MRRITSVLLLLALISVLAACPGTDTGPIDVVVPEDTGTGRDASMPDVAAPDVVTTDVGIADVTDPDVTDSDADVGLPEEDASPDVGEEPKAPTAREYCDATGEMFCDYYMRCGRMHAASKQECLSFFDETCNAVYAPHYIALEDDGRLALSEAGIDTCREHLETLECSTQIFDLDGPCAAVWEGKSLPGLPCGPGIGSFVCSEGTTCVLNLSLCGSCEATVEVGEPCGPDVGRCEETATCVEGTCVRRGRPGDSCDTANPCALGASCVEGTCVRFNVVAVGESCDGNNRCPYNAVCVGGQCLAQSGLGESCAQPGMCRSGYCDMDAGTCQPLGEAGAACGSGMECVSGVCAAGQCDGLPSACFR